MVRGKKTAQGKVEIRQTRRRREVRAGRGEKKEEYGKKVKRRKDIKARREKSAQQKTKNRDDARPIRKK